MEKIVSNNLEPEGVSKEVANTDDTILDAQEQINEAVLDITKKFKMEVMRCVNCPVLMECKYPRKRLEALRAEASKVSEAIYEEEVELDDSAENTLRAQNKRDATYKAYIEGRAYDVLQNDRCIYEKEEVLKVLQKFVNAGYDIADPRAFLIISELIGNILNSGRANKAFTSLGVILKKETPAGPIYYENPLLKTKMKFSELIITATEALDRMLKSDDDQKAEKNFTAHLLQQLRIRNENIKVIESDTK